jgi:hypothetical protein
MNLRDEDVVSAVALVMEESTDTSATIADELPEASGNGSEPTAEATEPEKPTGNGDEPAE